MSPYLGFYFQYLSFPSVTCVGKRDGCCHGISVKCSRYQDSGASNPSLVDTRHEPNFPFINEKFLNCVDILSL